MITSPFLKLHRKAGTHPQADGHRFGVEGAIIANLTVFSDIWRHIYYISIRIFFRKSIVIVSDERARRDEQRAAGRR